MARKRRRRRLRPAPVLWVLLIANVVAGLLYSPVTAATRVRVVGARESDKRRISDLLQWLQDRPCLSVSDNLVQSWVMLRPDVQDAALSRNLFGRGELKVGYFEPVALIGGTKNVVLTDGGLLCATPDARPQLPVLDLPAEAWQASFGIAGVWEPAAVAVVCQRAMKQGLIKNLSISVTMGGAVCLNSGVTGRVMLGAPDELDDKFEAIRRILTSQPNLMAQGKELVLIAPGKPVTRPLEGNPR